MLPVIGLLLQTFAALQLLDDLQGLQENMNPQVNLDLSDSADQPVQTPFHISRVWVGFPASVADLMAEQTLLRGSNAGSGSFW